MRTVEHEVGPYRDRAVYSDDFAYRYEFHRDWGDAPVTRRLVWVLLNPATGDTDGKPRPTLGRCITWTTSLGYDGLTIVNLFAYRATKPKDLLLAADPIGPDNDATLQRVAEQADRVLAAWGTHGRLLGRGRAVAELLPDAECLGFTAGGEPRHPLYVPSSARVVRVRDKAAELTTVWPAPGTLTLLAVVDPEDSERGWVRWTWAERGVVVQQLGQEALLARADSDFEDPVPTREWAARQDFGFLSAEGPWQ